jgi:hypothetical protein
MWATFPPTVIVMELILKKNAFGFGEFFSQNHPVSVKASYNPTTGPTSYYI